jgi:hypothetical protein
MLSEVGFASVWLAPLQARDLQSCIQNPSHEKWRNETHLSREMYSNMLY